MKTRESTLNDSSQKTVFKTTCKVISLIVDANPTGGLHNNSVLIYKYFKNIKTAEIKTCNF